MSRQTCRQCLRPLSVCYCAQLTLHHNRWPVHIIQDNQESRHALGTARIAALSLSNCRLIHVDPDKPQADSMAELQALRALQPSAPSRYRIRRQPGADTLSTLKAIVFTLETLETPVRKLGSMLATMDWVVDQQIRYMGHDVYQSNYQDKEYK